MQRCLWDLRSAYFLLGRLLGSASVHYCLPHAQIHIRVIGSQVLRDHRRVSCALVKRQRLATQMLEEVMAPPTIPVSGQCPMIETVMDEPH